MSTADGAGGHGLGRLTPAQESLFLTLMLRARDAASPRPVLGDAASARIADEVDYDFGRLRANGSQVFDLAVRTKRMDDLVRAFAAEHPQGIVLDLGCGLDPRARRCGLPEGVDFYDIDFPNVIEIRQRFLPDTSHAIAADLTAPGWLRPIPADRPAMVVADGLMAFLSGDQYKAMTRALTSHLQGGEFAFNAYTPLDLWAANRSGTFRALGIASHAQGFTDPREPEGWGAGLELIEELLLARAPEVALRGQPLRAFTRLCARSTWVCRQGSRVVRYRF